MKNPILNLSFFLFGLLLPILSFSQEDKLVAAYSRVVSLPFIDTDSIEYYYNPNCLLAEEIHLGFSFSSMEWENTWKVIYEYDANDNQTLESWQAWDSVNWVNDRQYIYEYDANNNRTLELEQDWDSTHWVNDEQYIYEYDANNNQTLNLWQYWDSSIWVNIRQWIFEYDANNNLTLYSWQKWDSNN